MGALVTRRTRTAQPQGAALIDRANPLGAKVIDCLPLNGQPYATVSGAKFTLTGGQINAIKDRALALRSGGGAACGSVPLNLSAYKQISIAVWLYWDAYANNDALAFELGSIYSSVNGLIVDPNCSSPAVFMFGVGGGGSNLVTFARPSASGWHRLALTFDRTASAGASGTAYVDGAAQTISPFSGSTTVTGNFASDTLHLFSRNEASLFGTGSMEMLTIYDGILTAAEAQADFENCYQVLKAPARRLWLAWSASTSGATGSLAWTEADDAVSIGGVITDPAIEGWTEADDAHALAGTVTDRAASAWTEADDAHALVGVINDSDALWWVEADDVVSITGTVQTPAVPVTGSLAWTEQDDGFAAFLAVATGGAGGYGKSKRRYVVRKGDQLYAFSDPAVAEAFLHADDEPAPVKQYPAKKKAKQPAQPAPRPAPVPEQQVDLAELRALAARQHAEAEYQQLMAQRRYEAMLILLERLREDEEDDWLLMAAE